MLDVEKIESIFKCDQCDQLLDEPVTISCGVTVCKFHLNEFLASFTCEFCNRIHQVPPEGFEVNKRLQSALKTEINILPDKMSKELHESLEELKNVEDKSEDFINEYYDNISKSVDIRKNDLKLQIDKYCEGILKKIETTRSECVQLSANWFSNELEKPKNDLVKLVNKIEKEHQEIQIDFMKKSNVREGAASIDNSFKRILKEYKDDQLLGGKRYTFEFKEIEISNYFGCLKEIKKFDSSIIDNGDLQTQLIELCEFGIEKWDLKYRASRDGFHSNDFHSKCDGITNTLTVIKATSGNIFGGFTQKAWSSNSGYVEDPHAFIFSLINKEKVPPFKIKCSEKNRKNAINCKAEGGPQFGGDIIIQSDSNKNNSSISGIGHSYIHPDFDSDRSSKILAGTASFTTAEIEVFCKR